MTCPFCRCPTTSPGTTTLTFDREHKIVVLRAVPAALCDQCGEPFVDTATAKAALSRAELALAHGSPVEVLQFAA